MVQAGCDASGEQRLEAAHQALVKAQDIISELNVSLDFSASQEIAQGLSQLYDYMYDRLVESNIKKEAEPITEVIGMLEEMREMWAEVARAAQSRVLVSQLVWTSPNN